MVEASTVLKVMMYLNTIFFIGMTTFPGPFAEGYKLDFSCPARPARGSPPCDESKNKALIYFAFNLFGIQLGVFGAMCGAMAREGVSKKAQSALLFVSLFSYPFIVISDLYATTGEDWNNSGTPKEGIYFNTVLFASLTIAAYLAWEGSGAVVPDVNKLVPTGRFSKAMILNILNSAFFSLPLMFFRQEFLEMYGLGPALTGMGANKWILMLIMGNTGKIIFWNTIATIAICSAEGGDKGDETQYRLLRAISVMYMFYMGSFSKDAVVNLAIDYENPGFAFMWFLNLAIFFYTADAWGKAAFTLKKSK